MEKYEKALEEELDGVVVEALPDFLREFFGKRFQIIKYEKGVEMRKGWPKSKVVAKVNVVEGEIYVDERYRHDMERFRDFYENSTGDDFRVIYESDK